MSISSSSETIGVAGQRVDPDARRSGHDKPLSNTATVDHLIPRCEGGWKTRENLVTACWSCNHDKGNLSVRDFVLGNSNNRHAQKASRRLRQRIKQTGDAAYALTVPLDPDPDIVLTAYDPSVSIFS